MTEISLKFKYTESEIAESLRKFIFTPKRIFITFFFTILILIIFIYATWLYLEHKNFFLYVITFFVFILMCCTVIYQIFIFPKIYYRRNPEYHEERTMILSESDISSKIENYKDIKYDWIHFNKIKEDEKYYFLYPSKLKNTLYLIIPKRVFKDESEEQVFKELVNRKLN